MSYTSYVKKVKDTLNKSKKDICNEMGNFVTAEAQMRAKVLTGNMKRSITYDVHDDNNGVDIGTTMDAPYSIYKEKGTSKMKAEPFLEPAVMDNIGKLEEIAKQKISVNMGGN